MLLTYLYHEIYYIRIVGYNIAYAYCQPLGNGSLKTSFLNRSKRQDNEVIQSPRIVRRAKNVNGVLEFHHLNVKSWPLPSSCKDVENRPVDCEPAGDNGTSCRKMKIGSVGGA